MIIDIQSDKGVRGLEDRLEVTHSRGNDMCKNLRNKRILDTVEQKLSKFGTGRTWWSDSKECGT